MPRKPTKNTDKKTKKIKQVKDTNTDPTCQYCPKVLEEGNFYLIYNLAVATNIEMKYIGLQLLLKELADYAMKKGYHLSASQIVLLRPDILKDFLNLKYKPEKIIFFDLQEHEICLDCYKQGYVKHIPER